MDRTKSPSDPAASTEVLCYPHLVDRVDVNVARPYRDFCRQYEDAVPALDLAHIEALVTRRAAWREVVADAKTTAPYDFFIFWKLEVAPIMRLAGHESPCTTYLMGNYMIAERMFRFDPAAMLYTPLRTVIYVDAEKQTRFVIDRPSSLFSSFQNKEISKVGLELDTDVVALLSALEVPAPSVLTRSP
jgi:hypothetical protein